MERKLTALLSADVKGYSRLMGDDEISTVCTLTAYREVMAALIHAHRGRVIDSPGDNLLAEFASVVDAVQGAVEIQRELKARNTALSSDRKMEFRIGINLGDVIVEGERLYGDGVNIAVRLESLADPGGISISGTVYDQIETKLALEYEYTGEQEVKNIAKPVRVYRVVLNGAADTPAMKKETTVGAVSHRGSVPSRRQKVTVAVVGLVLLVIVGAVSILYLRSSPSVTTPSEQVPPLSLPDNPSTAVLPKSDLLKHLRRSLSSPDKPSIVVLPFTNMSGDPEQEYFSDGMTDTLITDLSKLSGLFVIARNSAFTYKGKAVKVEQISQELGVRYALEGSVQRAGERIRINAQLIDATTSNHLWAERYDRPFTDVFALQDEIAQQIVTALKVQVGEAELERVRRTPTANLTAYDYVLRGWEHHHRYTKEAATQARQMFEKAIALDPQYADAYAGLGWVYWLIRAWGWSQDPQDLEQAFELAQKALTLEDSLPEAYGLLSYVYVWQKQYGQAETAVERAISLEPNNAPAYAWRAEVLRQTGKLEEAVGSAEQAIRLDPHSPAWYRWHLGIGYRLVGRCEEAIAAQKQVLTRSPNFLAAYTELALCYVTDWVFQLNHDPQSLERALEMARQAVTLNDSLPWAHATLGWVLLYKRQYEEAISQGEQTLRLGESDYGASYVLLAEIKNYTGRPEAAIELVETAMRLDSPFYADLYAFSLGTAYYLTGQHEEAIAALKRSAMSYPAHLWAYAYLAAVYSELGREEEARATVAEILRISPRYSLIVMKQRWPFKDPSQLERLVGLLRKTGLK